MLLIMGIFKVKNNIVLKRLLAPLKYWFPCHVIEDQWQPQAISQAALLSAKCGLGIDMLS